jgi:hypothetical protein
LKVKTLQVDIIKGCLQFLGKPILRQKALVDFAVQLRVAIKNSLLVVAARHEMIYRVPARDMQLHWHVPRIKPRPRFPRKFKAHIITIFITNLIHNFLGDPSSIPKHDFGG